MNILVIGGGIFGCTIAQELGKDHKVTIVEKESDIMQRASLANHNRIHFGYHYPRSTKTAMQCVESLGSFMMEFGPAVISGFPNFYAIAKENSFTTVEEFKKFCDSVGIWYKEEYPEDNLLSRDMLSASFRVREPIFNYGILKGLVGAKLIKSKVDVLISSTIQGVKKIAGDGFLVDIKTPDTVARIHFDKVINATYSNLNNVNEMFGAKPRQLRFEHTLIPVFRFGHDPVGLTVMDGPFCTIMPHGGYENQFLLWHVDGSVYSHSTDLRNLRTPQSKNEIEGLITKIYEMSTQWMPFMSDIEQVGVFSTQKVVEENKFDARVSEIALGSSQLGINTWEESPNFISILSGKVMTCVKIAYQIRDLFENNRHAGRYVL
jgi:hypothetical protein